MSGFMETVKAVGNKLVEQTGKHPVLALSVFVILLALAVLFV